MKADYTQILYNRYKTFDKCVDIKTVGRWVDRMLEVIFPVSSELCFKDETDFEHHLSEIKDGLLDCIVCSMTTEANKASEVVDDFFTALPGLIEELDMDLDAIFNGDPAAQSRNEVLRCYPGIRAIAAYRMAHILFEKNVPVVPRLITEYAHSKTGIDIHPGAQIGCPFFIDHGTGVVIGETCIIGNNVKIYQGVTLGGLSVNKKDAKAKRHPTIQDDVIIYAGATILGGETQIGQGSIIGGNTFITKSVESRTTIYHIPQHKQG